MKRQCVISIAVLLALSTSPASSETKKGICVHETGCPYANPGFSVASVRCGVNIEALASNMCSYMEGGQKKTGRYTVPVRTRTQPGGQCGGDLYEFTCLDF